MRLNALLHHVDKGLHDVPRVATVRYDVQAYHDVLGDAARAQHVVQSLARVGQVLRDMQISLQLVKL